jgi:hypothetical protein
MKLAHYWTRQPGEATARDGSRIRVVSRGWSDESMEQAAVVARYIAQRVARRIVSGDTKSQQYMYGDRPLPEPILRQFQNGARPRAMITRNMYGALVMNAQTLMFVDVDREENRAHTVSNDVQRVTEANGLAARLYKTAGGYRVLITNVPFEPGSPQSENLLRQFASDPLYVRLCQMQQSFRARLTPKPWRCGLTVPPVSFPYETPGDHAHFSQWEAAYQAKTAGYATCRYLATFGGVRILPEFEDLVYDHDQETKANSQLPLA